MYPMNTAPCRGEGLAVAGLEGSTKQFVHLYLLQRFITKKSYFTIGLKLGITTISSV